MDELESQIAKIVLGNTKSSRSYVFAMAEKAPVGAAELFVVAELPLLSPAAEEACERICLSIAASLKRAYKRPTGANAFENAIAAVNEELGKLAEMGQTQWIDKLSCILAVKDGLSFSLASCGKVAAFLLRNKEFTDISCSPTQSHPLKTFDSYSSGKIRLGDLLLLSTSQLFNYISMDRLLQIFSGGNFLTATRTVIQLLKENGDPQVSFGLLLNLQVLPGQTEEEDTDLENYAVETNAPRQNLPAKILAFAKSAFGLDKQGRAPRTSLPQVSMSDRIKDISGNTKNFLEKSKNWWQSARLSAQDVKRNVNVEKFRGLSKPKKYLFGAACLALIALIVNISLANHLKKVQETHSRVLGRLQNVQTLLSQASSSLLYKDDAGAANYLKQAQSQMPAAADIDAPDKDLYQKVLAQAKTTQTQMEKVFEPGVSNLGSLGNGNSLIKLPGLVGMQVGNDIIAYDKTTGQVRDGALSSTAPIVAAAFMSGNSATVYDGTNIYIWDFTTGKLSAPYNQNVPGKDAFAGMAHYPTNNRIYITNKQAAQIISFLPSKTGFSRPVTAVSDSSLSQAQDIAIDGSIYVLSNTGVNKFQNGKLTSFALASFPAGFSGGKIYTEIGFVDLYLLDSANNKILIFDKQGHLVNTLESKEFTKLQDFQVDEKNKVMYVLNGGSLLKVSLP